MWASSPVGDDRHHRWWMRTDIANPRAFGPQATEVAAVGAGEVPPAERIGQQGQDAAQGCHRAQQGGAGSAGLSPQAGFGVGSRQPSDPRRGPQHRGHGRDRRLARAISDTGWGQFVRIIAEKADRYGRTVDWVSRWLASSKTCSGCGHRLDELPLQIRAVDVPGVPDHPRSRLQRRQSHSRRRAGGETKRLPQQWAGPRQRFRWSPCKTANPLRQWAMKQEATQQRRKPPTGPRRPEG